jgi:hypothetical protein
MSGPGPGDAKYYSLIYDGISLLFTGVIFVLIVSILFGIVTLAVASSIAYSGVNEAVHVSAVIGIISGLIFFIIIYTYYYGGFMKLATADPLKYGIGRVGSIIGMAGQVIGISLSALLLSLTFSLSNIWTAYLMLSLPMIIGIVGTILMMVALYRLGEQFSVGYLSAGAVLTIFMAVIILFILIPGAIIVVRILGLLIGIPTIILLPVGLNEVKKVAENKLKQQ